MVGLSVTEEKARLPNLSGTVKIRHIGRSSLQFHKGTAVSIMFLWTTLALSMVLGSHVSEQTPLGLGVDRALIESKTVTLENALKREYDYIVVGAGPSGIVVADRLSEYRPDARVLLVERGAASTWESGGRDQTEWMRGSEVTRFDVPGLFQTDRRASYFCNDIEPQQGCVLGGGTAINSGIYFYPMDADWDDNFPTDSGWTSKDVIRATKKAKKRIPSTDTPSEDGKRYLVEPYDVFSSYLDGMGWKSVKANHEVNAKNRTYSRTPFMTIDGERGGPLGSYLLSSLSPKRKNFELLLNTKISRVIRRGSIIYGVEIENSDTTAPAATTITPKILYVKGGRNAKSTNLSDSDSSRLGKVILSSGALGTPKILFRSGVGPTDVLSTVKAYDPLGMRNLENDWINLPVGHNLVDHVATHLIFRHADMVQYNHSGAWVNPDPEDVKLYLEERSGPLAATNARISLWEEFVGGDGVTRVVQGNGRAGNAMGNVHPNNLLFTLYLGRGMSSRGRLTLTSNPSLNVTISTFPYFNDPQGHDLSAISSSITSLLSGYSPSSPSSILLPTSPHPLTLIQPPSASTSVSEYLKNYPQNVTRGSNHWLGSCKLAKREEGGVVDGKTRVWGTKNLFVVDAGIWGGMVSANPVGGLVVAAERAVERILGE